MADVIDKELAKRVGMNPTSEVENSTILSQIQQSWLTSWLTRT